MIHIMIKAFIVFILAAFFVAANVVTELANLKTMDPSKHYISDYLANVRLSYLLCAGFFALGYAMLLLGRNYGDAYGIAPALTICALGMAAMVFTKQLAVVSPVTPAQKSRNVKLEFVHEWSARITFTLLSYGLMACAWVSGNIAAFILAATAPTATFLYYRLTSHKWPELEEKGFTGLLLASLITLLAGFV